jgi:hypothetical protein
LTVGIRSWSRPDRPPVELNTALMESTFRLDSQSGPIGTVFMLARPGARPGGRSRHVMVTSAHLLDETKGETAVLVLRRRVGPGRWRRRLMPIRIRARGRIRWTKHPRADVAVLALALPRGIIRTAVPVDLLADDAALGGLGIHPGDELNCLGFPFGTESSRAGFPILRSGKIASYPLLPTSRTRVFLLDFPVFRGNSGGPVYLAGSPRNLQDGGESGHLIVGLVSREVMVRERIQELYGTRERSYPLGLAEIVHASLIREAIDLLTAPHRRRGRARRNARGRKHRS